MSTSANPEKIYARMDALDCCETEYAMIRHLVLDGNSDAVSRAMYLCDCADIIVTRISRLMQPSPPTPRPTGERMWILRKECAMALELLNLIEGDLMRTTCMKKLD
jgi:hypothetical protein